MNLGGMNKIAKVALVAVLFIGVMAVLGNVIWIPLKLSGTANVTENTPPPTTSSRYVANTTIGILGVIEQGHNSALKPIRITNVSTETGPVVVSLETVDVGLGVVVTWPNGSPYSTPAILAPGEHVDLMVGISVSGSAVPGPQSFKIVFS